MDEITERIDEDRYRKGVVPLNVGITGHRDLVEREVPGIRQRVRSLFEFLQSRFPDRPLRVLSPLAEGADRLVADVAYELGLEVTVVLPMPEDLYRADFETEESRHEFSRLSGRAIEFLELPVIDGASLEELARPGECRNRQYAQLGVFLCAHSHVLLALWDGKPSAEIGGTAQVVRFHHYDVMEGLGSDGGVSQQFLADEDGDLVYQIVVSRDREGGAPRGGLKPLDAFWLTTDEKAPKTESFPQQYADIFDRTARFNRDVREHAREILAERYSLVDDPPRVKLPISILRINRFFCAADWLAIHYQQKFVSTLRYSHACVFLMALMFLLYSDLVASAMFMMSFAVFLVVSYGVQIVAARGRWQEKYLEYRTLAEGLRVQFYWAAAGVTSGNVTKYAHDNFLQMQDAELGWIRNVMRVAGIACDVAPLRDPAGLAFVIHDWIGSESRSGQLKYYRSKASQHLAKRARNDRFSKLAGGVSLLLLLGGAVAPTNDIRTVMLVSLGVLLVTVSLREAYAYRIAEKDVIKQYEFMFRIFRNARKRLAQAATDRDRRRILRILGEAALDEHAEWILMHRERPLSESQSWWMEV